MLWASKLRRISPTCFNSFSSASTRGPFASNSLRFMTRTLPIDHDNPQSTKDIGRFLTSSYSGHETRLQAVLSLRPLEVNGFAMLDAFYRQLFDSVGHGWGPRDMGILRALMCKSTLELTRLSRLEKFFGYANFNFIILNLRSRV
jgi:hypothetical protein